MHVSVEHGTVNLSGADIKKAEYVAKVMAVIAATEDDGERAKSAKSANEAILKVLESKNGSE